MHVHIHEVCSECPNQDPKIISLFTREKFCGKHCWNEGVLKYSRMILRAAACEVEGGTNG